MYCWDRCQDMRMREGVSRKYISAYKSSHMATAFLNSEGITLNDYLEYSPIITRPYYDRLIGKCQATLKEQRRENNASRCAVSPRQCTCSHIITSTECHPKCRSRTASSRTVFPVTFTWFPTKIKGIHERTEIRWRWGCYRHCKWLAGGPRSRVSLQCHPGFGKTHQGQMHFCWAGLCWKGPNNIVSLTVSRYELLNAPLMFNHQSSRIAAKDRRTM